MSERDRRIVQAMMSEADDCHVVDPETGAEVAPRPSGSADLVAAYLAGLGAGSRRSQASALRTAIAASAGMATSEVEPEALQAFPWHELTAAHVAAMRAALEGRFAPATCNRALAAVRGVLRACWRLGVLSRDEYARAVDVPPVRGSRLPAGRDLAPGEIAALMQACAADPGPAGVRDAALLALALTCGLRVAEASALDLADLDPETGRLIIRGKGGKERAAWVLNGAAAAAADWLEIRGLEPGPLFSRIRKGGALVLARISPTSLERMLTKRARQAGVAPFSWHDLRRTVAGDLLDAGADLAIVQRILGHADPRTTARYDRRPAAVQREATARLHVPYTRRGRGAGPTGRGEGGEVAV